MKNRTRLQAAGPHCRSFALGLLAVMASGPAVADVAISQVPLFVSTSVEPNVMLQFDNSGSMLSIIWHEDYDRGHDYPNYVNDPDHDDGDYIAVSGYGQVGCSRSSCLYVPTPVDNTRYDRNYVNFLIHRFGVTNLRNGQIPDQTRLQVAKRVAGQIVEENDNVRFGLTRFNPPHRHWPNHSDDGGSGGTIVAACGSDQDDLVDAINDLDADSNTPLAETYYEITRYFRGLSRHYGGGSGGYDSPVEYPCQKNFVITITDGLPTYDGMNVGSDPDVPGPDGQTLPDWDGLSPATDDPPYPQYSDGEGGDVADEGSTLYLDDLAKFGYELDLGEGRDFDDDDAGFEQQRLETYTVGFTVDNRMLQDAADYGNGEYYTANNLEELTEKLQSALASIADKISTAASLAASSTEAAGDTLVFQARFRSGDWSGELSAYPHESVGDAATAVWDASDGIPAHGSRAVYTTDGDGDGIAFQWDDLSTGDRAAVGGEAILDFIRGDDSNEAANGGGLRSRSSPLGDIVHSTPAFVGDQGFGYGVLPGVEGRGYRPFVLGKSDRDDLVVVGANDGMLHVFDAADGSEVFAYVPRSLFPALERLSDPDYSHRYYVDGSPAVADAYVDGGWKTLAVTTLGAGGPGAFALDLTDPAGLDSDSVLWEISSGDVSMAQGQGNVEPGEYLGTAMGTPAVVRTQSGRWVAIFGNGYNSASDSAALIVVSLATGEVLRVLDTGATGDNGLAAPAAVDRDRDGSVDTVYAGDMHGNLWKFDLSADNVRHWGIAYGSDNNRLPLFTARDAGGDAQPITSRPDAMLSPHGGLMVVFGTGRYLAGGDPEDESVQSVYGIWDIEGANDGEGNEIEDTRVTALDRLQRQHVTRQVSVGDVDVRVLSRESVDYEGVDRQRGWVFDLSYGGERISRDATIFDGKAILVSTIPNDDPCTFGGRSALIELNPLTGTQFDEPVLDLNDDGDFDSDDGLADEDDEGAYVYPGMVDLNVGLATNPNILIRPDYDHEKQITGSNLNTQTLGEKGFFRPGRASWQQIR